MAEVRDVFLGHGRAYRETHFVSEEQSKAMNAIVNCRTAALGAHVDRCDRCGFEKISYNSCRNRHCPKCQTFAKEDWIEKQRQNLLNGTYFHVVFTIPAELRPVFLQNQREMYGLLFKTVSETILELCGDKKYLGVKPGITAVLHTWGQNLSYHPHLHCIVTSGGLTGSGEWRAGRKKFFLPVKVLSKKFRGRFLHRLRKENLRFRGGTEGLNNPGDYDAFIAKLYGTDWVVYCKPPFGGAQKVIEYLGRYTHRVAVSNNRIIDVSDGFVTFRWRDYGDSNKSKTMTLAAEEFIRRFLLHVLPSGFRKIRHFGLFASRDKGKRLALCRRLTGTRFVFVRKSAEERLAGIFGADFNLCPCCRSGHLSRASPRISN
jgi:hypothetical protein